MALQPSVFYVRQRLLLGGINDWDWWPAEDNKTFINFFALGDILQGQKGVQLMGQTTLIRCLTSTGTKRYPDGPQQDNRFHYFLPTNNGRSYYTKSRHAFKRHADYSIPVHLFYRRRKRELVRYMGRYRVICMKTYEKEPTKEYCVLCRVFEELPYARTLQLETARCTDIVPFVS
jgi:hypothetical protein